MNNPANAPRVLNYLKYLLVLALGVLAGCVSPPPRDVNNLCNIFRQYPDWYRATKDVERRWKVPVTVQMAIMHQESKFNATAKPPRTKLFHLIPWSRPSTAYGYAQALDGTWALYKLSRSGFFISREDFHDAVDFIGWYADIAHRMDKIPRDNTYDLYLAYHEGIGGYRRKTYLRKPWLIGVAHKVRAREQIYRAQLQHCLR